MGWIRVLMQAAKPPIRSLDALARGLIASPDGSDATQMHPRSLAALLGKLDRDQELDWLRHRPELQRSMSHVLGCRQSAIAEALAGTPGRPTGPDRHFAWADVPTARPLDLLVEPLPPGIPEEIAVPGAWTRLWWRTRGTLTSELVIRWLEARGLCRARRVRAGEALDTPIAGPLFVVLQDRSMDGLARASALSAPVCVASTDLPLVPSEWHVIESAPPQHWIDELTRWLAARLPLDGKFDPAPVADWLTLKPLAAELVDGLESALGLMGLVDRFGMGSVRSRQPLALAEQYFRAELAATHGSKEASVGWLRSEGLRAAVGLARRLLTHAPDPWDAPRTFEAWLDLVPAEYHDSVDVEWVKLALSDRSTLRPSDVEKAARRLPPGPFRVVQALARIGVLRAVTDDRFTIGPRWFALTLAAEAERTLLAGPPADWGEALLGPARARRVARRMFDRALSGEGLDHVLEAEDASDPAWVAALEGAFRATGLALLAGAEVSAETLEALWDEQLALLFTDDDGSPHPRIEFSASDADLDDDGALLLPGAWKLAALAISEQLPAGDGLRHPALRPWLGTAHDDPRLASVLDEVLAVIVKTSPACAWAVGALSLVERLGRAIGHGSGSMQLLAAAGRVVDEVDHDVLEWSTVLRASLPHAAPALESIANSRSVEWIRVASAVWHAWSSAGEPNPRGSLLDPEVVSVSRFWSHVPAPLVGPAARHATPNALRCFDATRWTALAEHWLETRQSVAPEAVAVIPPDVFATWLDRARIAELPREIWPSLWARFPDELGATARKLLTAGQGQAAAVLLDAAPLDRTPDLVRLMDWRKQRPAVLEALRPTLHRRVRARAAGWRDAFTLLGEVETALATTRRALG